MRRFYKMVTCDRRSGRYEIHLDGKAVKTPGGQILYAPNKGLAEAIMRECAAQETDIVPDNMPLTQLTATACERVGQERPAMEKTVLGYFDTDLICYRTSQPAAVAEKQAQAWDPWLAWFEVKHGVPLRITTGLQALRQPAQARKAVADAVSTLDDWRFTVLQLVTGLSGSLVLALAFLESAITPEELFKVMHVEESYKADIYNESEHGFAPHVEKQRNAIIRDLDASRRFLDLLKASS